MLQGYWQMSLAAEAQEVFTITTPEGLFIPTCVPCAPRRFERDGLLQGVMTELLAGLNCKIWVDDIVWWGANEDNLLNSR